MTPTPDKFIQGSLRRFDEKWGKGDFIESSPLMKEVFGKNVLDDTKIKSFLTQELKKAYHSGFKQGFEQGKGWQTADELGRRIKEV